jgi:hypothetical protein
MMLAAGGDMLESIGRLVAGTFAAMLPARYWPDLDSWLPVTGCATFSSVLTACAGATLATYGYLTSLPLTIVAFATATPLGWTSSYLWWTGVVRLASAIADEPRGDPVLTLIDSVSQRQRRHQQAATDLRDRRSREGPEVRDQVLPGSEAGAADAAMVVLASRRKPAWRLGTTVVIDEHWYRVARIDDVVVDGCLRTAYALVSHAAAEVARDVVYYDREFAS